MSDDSALLTPYINRTRPRPGYLHLRTSVTGRSSEGLDERRRRLLFRSWHRGIKEVDLVLGGYADARIGTMSEAELVQFEAVLEIPTPDLLSWLMGEQPVPAEHNSPVMRQMLSFHLGAKAGG